MLLDEAQQTILQLKDILNLLSENSADPVKIKEL
jgi:hypothetical protein